MTNMTTAQLDVRLPLKTLEEIGFDYEAQPKEFVPVCPLCGHRNTTFYCGQARFGLEVSSYYCPNCTFVYLNPRMTREAYGEFYARWYRKIASHMTGSDLSPATVERESAEYMVAVCNCTRAYLQHPCRRTCLDIGGSTGAFSNVLKGCWGYECTVLDPSADELALAEKKGHRTVLGLVEDYELTEQFSVVAMIKTVDHLPEPIAALEKIHELVAPHGIFIIDFVDFMVWTRSSGRASGIKIDHPSSFTDATARLLLSRTGFEPIGSWVSENKRHMLFVCRPVLPVRNALPGRKYIEQYTAELFA